MLPHEYSILGHSRTTIGRWLGVIAGATASALYLLAGATLHFLEESTLTSWIPEIIFWPLSAGLIYAGIHFLFNSIIWKCEWSRKLLKIPDISGTWECEGKTMDQNGTITHVWKATITIIQTWEKIKVLSKSERGKSDSVIAALMNEGTKGCRLMYRYSYEANAGEPVNSHVGFCDLSFNEDLSEASGDYFNNKGRWTFGQMKLTRKS